MTANAYTEDVQAALDAGMDAHVAKPIDFGRLFAVLNQYDRKKHSGVGS
jgi:CheY-like chemotaxis protein